MVYFGTKPSITVAGVDQNVGTEYTDSDSNHDVMWSHADKTIRFTGNAPANNALISITGKRQIPIFWHEGDAGSIAKYGLRQYLIKDRGITTVLEAVSRAESELQRYKDPLTTGSLKTYDLKNLASGSRIVFSVPSLDVSGSAIINNVNIDFRDYAGNKPIATVEFAPTKEYGIIDYLVRPDEDDDEDIVAAKQAAIAGIIKSADSFTVSDTATVSSETV